MQRPNYTAVAGSRSFSSMPIETAIRFQSLSQMPNGRAVVDFVLTDESGKRISEWSVDIAAADSADECIARGRRKVLDEMRFVVRLADAD
jgi:hypothetical protein